MQHKYFQAKIIKIFKREANLIGSIYEVQGSVDTTYGGRVGQYFDNIAISRYLQCAIPVPPAFCHVQYYRGKSFCIAV